jgi:hypothetical protein
MAQRVSVVIGLGFWGGDTEIKDIFKLQKRVMRIVSGVGEQMSFDYFMLPVRCK